MPAIENFPVQPDFGNRIEKEERNKRKLSSQSILNYTHMLAILLKGFPEIQEVYAKRMRLSRKKEKEEEWQKRKIERSYNKSSRCLLLEFYCEKHIPISRLRELELSLRRFLSDLDLFGKTVSFLFMRLSSRGEYKCMSQNKEAQDLYNSPRPLGLRIFQRNLYF